MKNRMVIAVFLLLGVMWGTTQAAQELEPSVDRPGGDYKNFDVHNPPQGSLGGSAVDTCSRLCEQDGKCKAWTFVNPGVQGPNGRCWLKNVIPTARPNNCCTSGVPMRTFESIIDRPGNDYRSFDLTTADPNLCKAACEGEASICMAWTFVKPGVQSSNSRCWLKNAVPPAYTNNCCTSGVRFDQPH